MLYLIVCVGEESSVNRIEFFIDCLCMRVCRMMVQDVKHARPAPSVQSWAVLKYSTLSLSSRRTKLFPGKCIRRYSFGKKCVHKHSHAVLLFAHRDLYSSTNYYSYLVSVFLISVFVKTNVLRPFWTFWNRLPALKSCLKALVLRFWENVPWKRACFKCPISSDEKIMLLELAEILPPRGV